MDKYRKGDVLRIRVTVSDAVGSIPLVKIYGHEIPVSSLDVVEVEQYTVDVGDRVTLAGGDSGVVKAVIMDVAPRQVVVKLDGKWPLEILNLEDVSRG